jgi:hypothetical protein
MFLIMKKNNVPNGKPRILFRLMLTDVSMSIDASFPMVGKSRSIIHSTIKCMHVDKLNNVKNHIAHTTTLNKIEGNL